MDEEAKALLAGLKGIGDEEEIVNYSHRILCITYKNKHIRMGQPPDRVEGEFSYGPSNKQQFISNPFGENITLNLTVGFLKEKLNEILLKSK